MKTLEFICRTALPLPLLLCVPGGAWAQTPAAPAAPASAEQINFSANQLSYDDATQLVTASGAVQMNREGNELRADTVTWNRVSGEVRAIGNVRVKTPQGDVAYADSAVLTDTLRDGVVENLLLVLEDGGRLAAQHATRTNGITILDRAAYSPCAVINENGCPKNPTWQINAIRVVHDPVRKRISYKGASLNLLGMPIIALPGLSHPDGSGSGGSGLLVPDVRVSRNNGVEIATPYYWRIADNRDLTVTPHVYTEVLPALEAQYRQLTGLGAFQVSGFVTYGSRVSLDPSGVAIPDRDRSLRGYVDANGRFQLTPAWSITASGRYVTDRTFLRRYDISQEDRLRSMLDIERVTRNSYISIAGWAFQGLRVSDVGRSQPLALPAIDARWRFNDPFWDGKIELQANSLAILRTDGQDSQRAFVAARWDRRSITRLGQELTLTAYARADVYHTADVDPADPAIYRGEAGVKSRGIAALAADLRWPFIGNFLGGTQRLTPRVQVVASPPTRNLSIPNEDARSVDLEDSNLFALNRFPGYDRWEDSSRITYGVDWALDLPRIAIRTNFGQSYRLNRKPSILPEGTGLSDRFSDFVGRTTVKFDRRFSLVHRFRLDKDSFAIRRNEIDAVIGGHKTYAEVGYLRLNRNIPGTLEDLRDREEIRLGGRLQFARFWSLFGSTVIDLTDAREDVLSTADGYQPVRHRLGLTYSDDCLEMGVTWRRDYLTTGDFKGGNTFMFRVALKNLGR
ncbi:MAG: LPS-assembly protein LptD [Alphaproteobacteria bacterium]|nr:LPS-assembly protein LptD [Alphaproteobacteria bacterium]